MAKNLKEWWEDESLINRLFVKPALGAAQIAEPFNLPAKLVHAVTDPSSLGKDVDAFQQMLETAYGVATLAGDVNSGEVPIFGEEGRTSPELIERSADYAMNIPLAGIAAGARPAANTLFSGGFADDAFADMTKTLATKPEAVALAEEAASEAEFLKLFNSFKDKQLSGAFPDMPAASPWTQELMDAAKANAGVVPVKSQEGLVPINQLSDEDWAEVSGDLPEDDFGAAMKAQDLAEVPWFTGNPDLDAKIAEAGQLGWKEEYITGLTQTEGFDPSDLNWYLNPLNLKSFSVSANAKDFVKPSYDPNALLKPSFFGPEIGTVEGNMVLTEHGFVPKDSPEGKQAISDALLKPKPLDAEKYPWLKKPASPHSETGEGYFDRYSSILRPIREQLYLRGMSQDPIIEMQRLMDNSRFEEAGEIGNELRALLPENWDLLDQVQSTIVPHAVDTLHQQFPENFTVPREGMQAAIEGGFDLENVLLRSTRFPTDRFLDPSMKGTEEAMFLTPANQPEVEKIMENYGRYVYPVVSRAQNPLERDFGGKWYGNWMQKFLDEAKAGGHDMAIARNMFDEGTNLPQDQVMLFDPTLLRSTYAKFDPNRLNENNLLASQVGGVNPFSWLVPEEEKKKKLGEYRF